MTRIPAPFWLESIPPEHAFGGLVTVVADGEMIEFDEERVGSVHLRQSWYSDRGKAVLRSEFLALLRSGKVKGMSEEDIPREDEVDPYVCVEMRRIGSEDDSVSWFWDGDGTYDGYEADGSDAEEMDDDVLGYLDDDTDEEDEEDEDDEDDDLDSGEDEKVYS